jgi:hypothetical protein
VEIRDKVIIQMDMMCMAGMENLIFKIQLRF